EVCRGDLDQRGEGLRAQPTTSPGRPLDNPPPLRSSRRASESIGGAAKASRAVTSFSCTSPWSLGWRCPIGEPQRWAESARDGPSVEHSTVPHRPDGHCPHSQPTLVHERQRPASTCPAWCRLTRSATSHTACAWTR